MASFAYQARDDRGQVMGGMIDAGSQENAMSSLLERGLVIISLTQQQEQKRAREPRIKSRDLIVFTRQLSTMIDAGLPLMECLSILELQAESVALKKVTGELRDQIERGGSFSEALEAHPRTFNSLYTCMVKAGEKGGFLPDVLDRVAGYQEANARLQKKVKSAMAYPMIVLVIAVGITSFLVFYMLPFFSELYQGLGDAKLPVPTQILMSVSKTVRDHALVVIGILVALVFSVRWLKRTRPGRETWDRTKLKVPVFGNLLKKIELARFLRTFASLVRSGVPILDVLDIVGRSAGNVLVERACKDANQKIQGGETISLSLGRHSIFPPMMIRMIGAGEVTGRVDQMLEKVAQFYEEEVEAMLAGLAALIEPLLIVVIGVIVGSIVICLFLPILRLADVAKF